MYLIIAILGLLIGSFSNVCIYRIPRGESIAFPPSHCSKCKEKLRPWDLVPVLSFIFLKARCRYCKDRISVRYPLVELLTALLFLLVFNRFGLSFQSLIYMILADLLLIISFIDIDHMIIPNKLNIIIGIIGLIGLIFGWTTGWLDGFLGLVIGGGILLLLGGLSLVLFKKEAMGGGDIKLLAVAGLYLGVVGVTLALFLSAYLAIIINIIILIFKKTLFKNQETIKKGQHIPYGPFLAMAIFIVALYGDWLIALYLKMFL